MRGLARDRQGQQISALIRRLCSVTSIVFRRGAKILWHAVWTAFGHRGSGGHQFSARQVRLGLEELGPTFVKLGQLLSTRSDLVPSSLQQELLLLRDHVSAIPTDAVLAEVLRSTGSSIPKTFSEFDLAPVASASIGQVHRATTLDGRRVAVKIRRPGIRSEIEIDVNVLVAIIRIANLSRTIRRYDPMAVVNEFSRMLRAESDFSTEAGNIEAVRRIFLEDDAVSIPSVLWEHTNESILVMDWIEGIPLTDAEALKAAGVDRTAIAQAIIHAYATMIVRSDRFHADPHLGNFIAVPGGRLGLVDFGEVGTVDTATRTSLTRLLVALISRDHDELAAAVLSIARVCRPLDRARLSDELSALVEPVINAELHTIKLGRLLRDLLHVLRDEGLILPASLAVLVKTVIECEATADELDPTLSLSSFLGDLGSVN